jgi:hypothetical protein
MNERKKMVTAEEIEEAALELPDEELISLVERLNAQLPVPEGAGFPWMEEAMRRSEDIRSGRAPTRSLEEVLEELERSDAELDALLVRQDVEQSESRLHPDWDQEIADRIVSVDSGESIPTPLDEALARWKRQIH